MKTILGFLAAFALVTSAANAAQIGEDNLTIGKKGSTANKTVNMGNGRVVWNQSTSKLTFSNDAGSSFKNFGSGGGGGGGINFLVDFNFDFEGGTAAWTASGGAFTTATAGGNLIFEAQSGVFNSSATGQFLSSTNVAIPQGFKSNNGAAGCYFKTAATDYKLQVFDGSNVIAETLIYPSTIPQKQAVTFIYPSSGNVRLRIASQSDAGDLALDNCFLGENTLISVSQATYYGGITVATNCELSNAGSVGATALVGNSTCVGSTAVGQVTSLDDTTGKLMLDNLPPGEYEIIYHGQYRTASASTNSSITMTDGTTSNTQVNLNTANASAVLAPATLRGHFTYTATGNRYIQLMGAGNVSHGLTMTSGEAISVYRYPTQTEQVVRPDVINWVVDAYTNGASFTIPHTTVAAFGPEDVTSSNAAVLNLNSGSTSAFQACDAADSTGLSCAGNTRAGLAFVVPTKQKIEVCADFVYSLGTGGGNAETYFTLNKAANTTNSILKTGITTSRVALSGAGASQNGTSMHLCETYDIDVAGKHTFVLNVQGEVFSGIGGQSLLSTTPHSIHWTARPLTQSIPAPVLVGSVTTASAGSSKLAAAQLNSDGTIAQQTGAWVTTAYHPSAGHYELTYTPGTFGTVPPYCIISGIDNGATDLGGHVSSLTTTSVAYVVTSNAVAVDVAHTILCFGDK